MLLQNFEPALNGEDMRDPTTISVGITTGSSNLPEGGTDFEFTNISASGIAYLKFYKRGNPAPTATTSNGCPLLAGQSKIYRCPPGMNAVAHIGSAAVSVIVVAGRGT